MNYTYNKKEAEVMLNAEINEYEATKRLKADERKSLYEWVADGNSVHSNPFYMYGEDGRLMDYVSALRNCLKEHKSDLCKELKSYEAEIEDLTDEERKDLHEWVADGNSVYDNPYYMSEDNGKPMDYIEAIRITADMRENPENY